MKNIALIDYDFSIFGGVEKVTQELANGLSNCYNVYIISINKSNKNIPYSTKKNIEIIFLNRNSTNRLRYIIKKSKKKLSRYLKKNNIEVVLCMGHYACFASIACKLFSNTKFIFCDHGALINQWNDKKTRLMRKINSMLSDYTVVLTDRTLLDYIKLFHIKSSKITRIYNFIPADLLKQFKNLKYNLKSNKIISVGRLSEEKGFDLLLEIAKRLKRFNSNWIWDIYGDGNLKEEIASKIVEFKLEKNVFLKGNDSDIIKKYNDYGVYALTSYREGLPLVLLEAKVNKLPIISFDIETGPNEIVENNINGFLVKKYNTVEYAKKLNKLLNDEDLRQNFSDNAYCNIEKFKEEKILKEWENLINRLLEEK